MILARTLKAKLKVQEEKCDRDTQVRIHRAISWLGRSEQEQSDPDARFIFLWIAFNAAYAQELGAEKTERELLTAFLQTLVDADADKRLHKILFGKYAGPVRLLIGNRFVFDPFWRAVRQRDTSDRWKIGFDASQKAALAAMVTGNTHEVLSVVFDRLYVLRNQLVHGSATWSSAINRPQLNDGVAMLDSLVSTIIDLMLEHPDLDFGPVNYPVI